MVAMREKLDTYGETPNPADDKPDMGRACLRAGFGQEEEPEDVMSTNSQSFLVSRRT